MMRFIYYIVLSFLFLTSCTHAPQHEVDILKIPIQQANFSVHSIDSTKILNPGGLYCYRDYVLIIENKNNPAFSFWKSASLQYAFSAGFIGGGPNEFIRPRSNYFAISDSSFFILDSNIEWEVQIKEHTI